MKFCKEKTRLIGAMKEMDMMWTCSFDMLLF